ncbi:MAG: adenylate/guanylate cyclase domain-containing protein [Candidatus Electrothrix sp. YB6]
MSGNQIQEQLFAQHPVFLHFRSPALENEFKRFQSSETLIFIRAGFLFGALTLTGNIVLTYVIAPQYFYPVLLIFSSFYPLYFFGFYSTYYEKYSSHYQYITSAALLVIALSMFLWAPVLSEEKAHIFLLFGELGCLFVCFYAGQLRFTFSVPTSLVFMGTYQVYLIYSSHQWDDIIILSYVIWLMEGIACFSGFLQERNIRTLFLQKKIINEQQVQLNREYQRSEDLLHNILPHAVAERLKDDQTVIADHFPSITVLFADIVGFTELSEKLTPTNLIQLLNRIFSLFDDLAEQYDLEKIKTIGDAYMVAGGIPEPKGNHIESVADFALEMQRKLACFNLRYETSFEVRVGIHTGPAVAGVIGIKKFVYDIWGDTVNTASRMESHGIADQIQVSETTYAALKDAYMFKERGLVEIKGKGKMRTYFLQGKK